MTVQANRPAPRFQAEQTVWTPSDDLAFVGPPEWCDGEWTYLVQRKRFVPPVRYAEHELTEAGR